MIIQEHVIEETRDAVREFFRNAHAVAPDKIEWSPLDAGRNVISLSREAAICPTWAADMLNSRSAPDWSAEAAAASGEMQASWTTIEECQKQCETRLEDLFAAIRKVPNEELSDTIWLPYDGGRDFTLVEVMSYPRWNLNYHTGQVCYIQILYGDKEMH